MLNLARRTIHRIRHDEEREHGYEGDAQQDRSTIFTNRYDPILQPLVTAAKDYILTHGSILKHSRYIKPATFLGHPVGVSLVPTIFPRKLFKEALDLQFHFNELYARVASDPEWLYSIIKPSIDSGDEMSSILWSIWTKVIAEGLAQKLSLGIWRSDYMLQYSPNAEDWQLKQVEFNTMCCAGGLHGQHVSKMHSYFATSGAWTPARMALSTTFDGELTSVHADKRLPHNETEAGIVEGIASAMDLYEGTGSPPDRDFCIVMIVQPHNINVADERPIEYALWHQFKPTYRLEWQDALNALSIDGEKRLLYSPQGEHLVREVAVVYWRAGHELHEYNDAGRQLRLMVEISLAIKCPSVLGQIIGFKTVQAALSASGALQNFVGNDSADIMHRTFVHMRSLREVHDDEMVRLMQHPERYVLKPSSLEGGGHNVYGKDIVDVVRNTPREKWHSYMLMDMIESPVIEGTLLSPSGIYTGPVVSELGVFGACVFRMKGTIPSSTVPDTDREARVEADIRFNRLAGWSLKTKPSSVSEMSVVKGYGCFDSPLLV